MHGDGPIDPRAGTPTGVTFTMSNEGDSVGSVSTYLADRTIKIFDASGVELWDIARGAERSHGGPSMPDPIQPGQSKTYRPPMCPSLGGPLTIVPICQGRSLAPLPVNVASPGGTPSAQSALTRAIAATDGVFSSCVPRVDGTTTGGELRPPDGASLAALKAGCVAEVSVYEGFVTVDLGAVAPASAMPPRLPTYWFDLPIESYQKATVDSEAVRWTFVVTANDVETVQGPVSQATTIAGFRSIAYTFEGGRWSHSQGVCEPEESTGPAIVFFDPC